MPELPEVETIRRILTKQIVGRTIMDLVIHNVKSLEGIDEENFINNVRGATINSIDRRGKYFIFNITGGRMVLHLRLDGQLYVTSSDKPVGKYPIITFGLSNDRTLHFEDKRKFAKASFVLDCVKDTVSGVHKLGLEPFDEDLTANYLKRHWSSKYYSVKEALLEQDVVAGFGNFYSDDLLFLCGIYPKKQCANLSLKNYEDLAKTMPEIMTWGIMADSVAEKSYAQTRGKGFEAKGQSYAYGRAGQPCRVCGTKIESMKLAGRTCCYCPSCQRRVKIVQDEVTPDMLCEVAKYVGSYINIHGKTNGYYTPYRTKDVSWEQFVYEEYKNLMTEDMIKIGDERNGEYRKIKSLIIAAMDDASFNIGINWIKSQEWKE